LAGSNKTQSDGEAYAYYLQSVDLLRRDWDDLDPVTRHDLAVECAKVAGAHLPDFLFPYSGEELSPLFLARIEQRIEYLPHAKLGMAPLYEKVAAIAPIRDPRDTMRVLAALDKEAGIDRWYGRIPDPVQAVFEPVKVAERQWATKMGSIKESQLRKFASSEVGRAVLVRTLGDAIADDLAYQGGSFFDNLPQDKQRIVLGLCMREGLVGA